MLPNLSHLRGRMGQVVRRLASLHHESEGPGFKPWGGQVQPSRRSLGVGKVLTVTILWVTIVESCKCKAYGCTMAVRRRRITHPSDVNGVIFMMSASVVTWLLPPSATQAAASDSPLLTSLCCMTSRPRICLTFMCRCAVLPCNSVRRPSGLTKSAARLSGGCAVLSGPFLVSVDCPMPLCQLPSSGGLRVAAMSVFCTRSNPVAGWQESTTIALTLVGSCGHLRVCLVVAAVIPSLRSLLLTFILALMLRSLGCTRLLKVVVIQTSPPHQLAASYVISVSSPSVTSHPLSRLCLACNACQIVGLLVF
jgi:hypothetical protein